MNFNEAYKQIKEKYDIRKETLDTANIDTDIMIDEINGLSVGLVQNGDKAVLTDYADLVNDFELDTAKVEQICKKYDVGFKNYAIEKTYNSLDDLEQYLNCIEEILETIE